MAGDSHWAAHNAHQFLDRAILIMLIKSGVLSKETVVSFLRDQARQLTDSEHDDEAKVIRDFVDVLEASLAEPDSPSHH